MDYTGKYHVGEIVTIKFEKTGSTHEVKIIDVWTDDNFCNGVTIVPTGNYGFPVDTLEETFDKHVLKGGK